MSKSSNYCCICGCSNANHATGFIGNFEQFDCNLHSIQTLDAYCNQDFIGFCSICGKSQAEGCEHVDALKCPDSKKNLSFLEWKLLHSDPSSHADHD